MYIHTCMFVSSKHLGVWGEFAYSHKKIFDLPSQFLRLGNQVSCMFFVDLSCFGLSEVGFHDFVILARLLCYICVATCIIIGFLLQCTCLYLLGSSAIHVIPCNMHVDTSIILKEFNWSKHYASKTFSACFNHT